MGFPRGVLIFTVLLASGSAYYILDSDDPTASVIWPTSYNYKADIIDVVNGNVQTYEVWASGEHNRSRIDFFGGIKKKFYVDETEEEYGKLYIIYTKTDKNLQNSVVCEQMSSDDENAEFLPDLDGYERKEEIELDGKKVQVWKTEKTVDDLYRGEKTLYVYRTEYDFDIPIKSTVKLYQLAKGDLETYIITNYKSFGYIVSLEDVSVDKDSECTYEGVLGNNFQTDLKYLDPHIPGELDKAFLSYKRHHNKMYGGDEHEIRKNIFHENWKLVVEHNSKNLGSQLELNKFADYTDEEFAMLTGTRPSDTGKEGSMPSSINVNEPIEEEIPDRFDMRLDGYMRPVRNQGNCGSCWAFTTSAVVEGALSRSNGGRNLDLSEQSLVDCAWGYENLGCNGGELTGAFQYVLEKGIPTEHDYGKYMQIDGVCHLQNMTEVFKIRGFSKVTSDNVLAMKTALYKYGPVAVAVYAGKQMKLYSSGILYDFDCDSSDSTPNHGVVVVGYDVRDGVPYWIIRNSWGETWGEDGYMLLSAVNNNCHVMDTAYYAVV